MASAAYAPVTRTKMVALGGIPVGAGIEFLEAEVFIQPDIPFSIVYYSLNGDRQEDGMRVDLDKQIFLDHFDDEAQERFLEQARPEVLDRIFTFFESQPVLAPSEAQPN